MTDPADGSTTDPHSPTYDLRDGIATVTLDDGKANAVTPALLEALGAALDRAEGEAQAVVLTGREGRFSAGFDLKVMTESPEAMRSLVGAGARWMMKLYGFGLPTVAACTGHALAAGALTLLCCDHRVGTVGPFKIGLNEVGIGMALPIFAVELARQRLTAAQLGPATMQARIYDPAAAVTAGYLDRVVPAEELAAEAHAEARRLAELPTKAYGRTKQVVRGDAIERILAALDDDLASAGGPRSS